MKTITQEQIKAVLQTIYNTNISAKDFNVVRKFFNDLPEVKEEKKK
jgi:hypothetical protein